MSQAHDPRFIDDMDKTEAVIEQLGRHGWAVQPDFVPTESVGLLRAEALEQHAAGLFKQAGVGSGSAHNVLQTLRGDAVRWLDEATATLGQAEVFQSLEMLRLAANRSLMLGLFELETHFAIYPSGAFYKKHVDRFRDDDARTLSVILYLNDAWEQEDGGQLRIEVGGNETVDLTPEGGTLVAFLSDRFPHEVLPARRERVSLTGWFKRRS